MTCPKCGSELDNNGLIMWCNNAHVYIIVSPKGEEEEDEQ